MKRFIIISALVAMTVPALGCAWCDSHNYYLFHVYDDHEFSSRMLDISNENWKAYLGSTKTYYWFDADEVIEAARKKNDDLMVSYVQNLQKYLDCARDVRQEAWDYPTKEELAQRKQTLQAVKTYALGKIKSRLRSQHALLLMRCNMLLGLHQENVTFWKQTASQLIETVYKDMMKDIYAGALYKTGRDAEAGEIFAELGDYNSLMTQYYKRRSFAAIRQEYLRNPNAKVLPFLVQDFVNNTQEAYDTDNPESSGVNGKLFVRDITRQEALQMRDFCKQVVSEGKSETPMLWKSAQAWIEYMFGDMKQAANDIIEAANLNGTEPMRTCTRSLILYITASLAKDSETFDNYLAGEFQWLDTSEQLYNVRDRVTHQALTKHYASQPSRVLALLKAAKSYDYEEYIDTMRVEALQKYFFYTSTPAQNDLDRYLKPKAKAEPYEIEDLIGTKYMRLCEWDKAIGWLKDIPASFYEGRRYAVYAANRSYTVEPWIKRQFLKESMVYSNRQWKLSGNPKLTFAKEMRQMEGELNVLTGQALSQLQYDLAVRYAQANFKGDCWWLMRNAKSVADELRFNEIDLAGKAYGLLRKVSTTNDNVLKEKALFALSYRDFYDLHWFNYKWNSDLSEYVRIPDPTTQHYKAFQRLVDYERDRSNTALYVSRCDEYIQFRKHCPSTTAEDF